MRFLSTIITILLISSVAFAENNQTEVWHTPSTYSGDNIVEREERLSNLYDELDKNPDEQRRQELYTLIVGAYRDLLTFMHDPEAYSVDDGLAREDSLARIYEQLEQCPAIEREAELFYQEAMLMLETPEEMYSLKLATNNLLYAIELDPDCMEYKEILYEVYEDYWKDRDFASNNEASKSRQATKDRVEVVVKTYRGKTDP